MALAWPPPGTSTPAPVDPRKAPRSCCWTRPPPGSSLPRSRAARPGSAMSSARHSTNVPNLHLPHPRCNKRPTDDSDGRLARRCPWPSACTRMAGSPTCVPTRSSCRTRPLPQPARPSSRSTETTTCPRRPGSTRARPRVPRKHTRPFGPQARSSGPQRPVCRHSTTTALACTT